MKRNSRSKSMMRRKSSYRGAGGSIKTNASDEEFRLKGWVLVKQLLPRIREYGRSEGLLNPVANENGAGLANLIVEAQAEHTTDSKQRHPDDKVHLPTNDLSLMHEAIPFLPVPTAVICFILNLVLPGSGSLMGGVFGMCVGQPRIQMKEGRAFFALIVNAGVATAQFMTVTLFLVGWGWSLAWGGLMIIHSMQYRKALIERRKEAMATAALEALTNESVMHRKDIKKIMK